MKRKAKRFQKTTASSSSKKTQQENLTTDDRHLFFYRPNDVYGELSQWYPSTLTVKTSQISSLIGHSVDDADVESTITFNCAEQFMMYCKAGRFNDKKTQDKVLATNSPKEQKRLGKLVAGFTNESWDEVKSDVVVAGNIAKFGQNPELKCKLLETGSRELVEAASRDRIWGIGYGAKNALSNRLNWGENRLGKALMEAREHLREEDEVNEETKGDIVA